jgi:hypothetical protein
MLTLVPMRQDVRLKFDDAGQCDESAAEITEEQASRVRTGSGIDCTHFLLSPLFVSPLCIKRNVD